MSNTNAAPQIVSGGESLDVFEIMQRFRTDGSCEYLIKEALEHLANVRADTRAVPADAAELLRRIREGVKSQDVGPTHDALYYAGFDAMKAMALAAIEAVSKQNAAVPVEGEALEEALAEAIDECGYWRARSEELAGHPLEKE